MAKIKFKKIYFILIFLVTVIITKFIIYLIPSDLSVWNDMWHHAYFGLFLVFISLLILKSIWGYILLAFSSGLVVEEMTFIIVNKWILQQHGKEIYFSIIPSIGTIILVILVVLIINFGYKKFLVKRRKK